MGQTTPKIGSSPGGSVPMVPCLFDCLPAYLKSHMPKFQPIYSVHITCGLGSHLLWRQCIMLRTSGFVVDIIFSYNESKRPQTKTTCKFCPVRQVAALGKVCHLLLHAVLPMQVFKVQTGHTLLLNSMHPFFKGSYRMRLPPPPEKKLAEVSQNRTSIIKKQQCDQLLQQLHWSSTAHLWD